MSGSGKRALIVIDVRNEYFDGVLPITSPPRESSLANIGKAMDAATAAGVPVIVVRHVETEPDAPIFRAGTPAIELHQEVAARPRDHDVEKHLPGSFTGTPLGDILDRAGIDTLSVTGYMTHMCVDTTARQAVHRGMTVEILDDATGTLALDNAGGKVSGEELHRAILAAQAHGLSEVISTEVWLARIGAAG